MASSNNLASKEQELRKVILETIRDRKVWQNVHNFAMNRSTEYRSDLMKRLHDIRDIKALRMKDMEVRNTLINNGMSVPEQDMMNHQEWLAYFQGIETGIEGALKMFNWAKLLYDEYETEIPTWEQFWDIIEGKITKTDGGGLNGTKMKETLQAMITQSKRRRFLETKLEDRKACEKLEVLFVEAPEWREWKHIEYVGSE